jgi:hypothetical protein
MPLSFTRSFTLNAKLKTLANADLSSYHEATHIHLFTMTRRVHGGRTRRRQANQHKMIQGSGTWGNQKDQHLLSKGGGAGKIYHLCRRKYPHPTAEVLPRTLIHLQRSSLQSLQERPESFFYPRMQRLFEASPKAVISIYLPRPVLVRLKAILAHQSPRNAGVEGPLHAQQPQQHQYWRRETVLVLTHIHA